METPNSNGRAQVEIERRIRDARPAPFDRRRSNIATMLLPILAGFGAWVGARWGHLGVAAGALPALVAGTVWAARDRKRPIYWRVELEACDVITAARHGSTLVLDVVPTQEQHTMLGIGGRARHRSRTANPAPRAVALAGLEHESEERRAQLLERAREWLSGRLVNVTIDAHWVQDRKGRLERAVIDAVSIEDDTYRYTDLPGTVVPAKLEGSGEQVLPQEQVDADPDRAKPTEPQS